MLKIKLSNANGPKSCLSLHSWTRTGDLAADRILMGAWKRDHSDHRLTIFYDPFDPVHAQAKSPPIEWVFKDIADEIWLNGRGEGRPALPGIEVFDLFNGKNRNYVHRWRFWGTYAASPVPLPQLDVHRALAVSARGKLDALCVPRDFLALQPLYDAGYHKYRNAPFEWWVELAARITKAGVPIVWLSSPSGRKPPPMQGLVYGGEAFPTSFEALAASSNAKWMVGGETGLPVWSAILRVPVLAVFRHWSLREDWGGTKLDYRPISFGAPVVHVEIRQAPEPAAASIVKAFFEGAESTPKQWHVVKTFEDDRDLTA